ncbi:sulfite exporter TauE/SafE family protein [Pannonibacter sp. Pt2-lr]|uniref:Probable membrane transporter protein n=1 Tax=Pannonibacter anstelovis TaxID=3121537 RepID=A0ABU7ZNI5_9HYPH
MENLVTTYGWPTLITGLVVLFTGGVVRGFAGFGAGMIFMPVASALFSPPAAAGAFLLLDYFVTLPLLPRALRLCDWRTVLPAVLAAVVSVHLGAWMLVSADPLILRWVICLVVLALLGLLISGWRYSGTPSPATSAGVGVAAGIMGGVSQVSGPPVVAFWLSSPHPPHVIRANLIVFFALAGTGSLLAYLIAGVFNGRVVALAIGGIAVYGLGLYLGARGFGRANPQLYRRIAYSLIALAALTSLPALDGWLGR